MTERIPTIPPIILPVVSSTGAARPLFSVIIPAYNCIGFLAETLQSVLMQDLGSALMQIEVVDDYSTDGDVSALVEAVGKGRIKYFRQEKNQGSLRNFETCINRAEGQWVHLLHGDDRVEMGFYKEIASLFAKYPEAGAAFTNFSYIDEKRNILNVSAPLLDEPGIVQDFLFKIASNQLIQPPAIVVKRSVYEALGSFYAVHYGEDWEMWTRIAANYPIGHSPKCLASYRLRDGNISQKSYLTGQNILDMVKVIGIIQTYLPVEKRKRIKNLSLKNLSILCTNIAIMLYPTQKAAAYMQLKAAYKLHKNLKIFYIIARFIAKRVYKFVLGNYTKSA